MADSRRRGKREAVARMQSASSRFSIEPGVALKSLALLEMTSTCCINSTSELWRKSREFERVSGGRRMGEVSGGRLPGLRSFDGGE